jgi:MoaA/NifB/PqqE/SkfB family radical SAM enzyme
MAETTLPLPRSIRLESSSRCQLKCPACPTATKAIDAAIGSGVLKLEDFRRFVLDHPAVEHIEISNYGEVFLNPEIVALLRLAHEQGVVIRMANGVNLNHATDEILEALVLYGVEKITCSIDGASQETYAQYRVRGDFDRVIGHVRRINHYKALHRSNFPRLRWQFIVFGHNEHEIPRARALARELGMEMDFKLSWDSDFSPIRDKEGVRKALGYSHLTREEYAEEAGQDLMQGICHQLWHEPQLNWDGKNLGCCRNFWGDFGGNAFTDGLSGTFHHEKMGHARRMLLGLEKPRRDIPCSTCAIYHRMRKTGNFLSLPVTPPFWKSAGRQLKRQLAFLLRRARRPARPRIPTPAQ